MDRITTIPETGDKHSPFLRKLCDAIDKYRIARANITPEEIERARLAEIEADRLSQIDSIRRRMRELSGLDADMWERGLETFPVRDPSQAMAIRLAACLADALPGRPNKPIKRGFCLWGDTGRGKSGILQGFAMRLLEKPRPVSVLYVYCGDITDLGARIDIEFRAAGVQVVILDDIEKGLDDPGSKWRSASDKLIRSMVTRADRTGKPIICASSNFSLETHKSRFRSPAWTSKLGGLMYWHEVQGPDLRSESDEPPNWLPYAES